MHAVTYEHGVHLPGTPLWFDAQRRRELCILMGVEQQVPPLHRRLLTSPALALALDQMGYIGSVLPSPWGRWIGVGGQRMQLIDAQAAPGAAAALVGDDAPLLVTGMLRAQAAEWPRAEHVVARLPALRHGGQALPQAAQDVARAVEMQGGRSAVWVDSLEVGLALHTALLRLGLVMQPKGVLSTLLAPAPPTARATLAVARHPMPFEAGAIRVSAGLLPWGTGAGARGLAPPIKLRWYADLAALQSVLTASRARRVSLIDVPPAVEGAVRTALGAQVRVRFLGPLTCGISQRS